MQALSKTLQALKPKMREFLETITQDGIAMARSAAPESVPLAEAAAEFALRGGKHLRGALVIMGHRALRDETKDVYFAAAALELFHSYLLVHDDIMDNDTIRRGGPTLHVHFAAQHGDAVLGQSLALIAGDLLSAWTEAAMLMLPARTETFRALQELSRTHRRVLSGQYLDVLPKIQQDALSRAHDLKTSEYSFLSPLRVGGYLAGADEGFLSQYTAYAETVGRAFQARDDYLGAFGDPAIFGKPVGADFLQQKRTWLWDDLQRESPKAAAMLQALRASERPQEEKVRIMQEVMITEGSKARCEAFLANQATYAATLLKTTTIREDAKDFLCDLAVFVGTRDS